MKHEEKVQNNIISLKSVKLTLSTSLASVYAPETENDQGHLDSFKRRIMLALAQVFIDDHFKHMVCLASESS